MSHILKGGLDKSCRKQITRMQWRSFKLTCRERLHDAANIAWPIFVVTGIGSACLKFWLTVWGVL